MKTRNLTKEDQALVEIAKATILEAYRRNHKTSTTVGSALITESENIYKGVNLEVRSSFPTSMCAEMGAVNNMISNNETELKTIVTIWLTTKKKNNWDIIPPCGACRHLLKQFGNPFIIISKTKKVRLDELYPNSER